MFTWISHRLFWYIVSVIGVIVIVLAGVLLHHSREQSWVRNRQAQISQWKSQFPTLSPPENSGGKVFSVANENVYAILFFEMDENRNTYLSKNERHRLPVIILRQNRDGDGSSPPPPRVYTAIWEDGTIVWGTCKNPDFTILQFGLPFVKIEYFGSEIDPDTVKKFLADIANSSIWQATYSVYLGGYGTDLHIRKENTHYFVRVPGVTLGYKDSEDDWTKRGMFSVEDAREWARLTKEIFDMIPKEGVPVDISYGKFGFYTVGIVESSGGTSKEYHKELEGGYTEEMYPFHLKR